MRRHRPFALNVAALALGSLAACSGQITEEKARAAADAIKDAIKPLDHAALDQDAPQSTIERIQRELTALHEYQGPITGKLDRVTINGLEAFQRTAGFTPDGALDEDTLQALSAAAKAAS